MDKDCSEIQEQLSGYLDHILSDEEEFEVEVHLAHCESCRDELHALMKIHDTLAELKTVKAPDDFLSLVQAKISASSVEKTEIAESSELAETVTPEEKPELNSMQAVVFPKEELPREDKAVISEPLKVEESVEEVHDSPVQEDRIEPDVMTPEQMTEQTHIDLKTNKLANIVEEVLSLFKKRSYQAGLGLALASICMMIVVRNSGMDKPVQMTASSDMIGQSFDLSKTEESKPKPKRVARKQAYQQEELALSGITAESAPELGRGAYLDHDAVPATLAMNDYGAKDFSTVSAGSYANSYTATTDAGYEAWSGILEGGHAGLGNINTQVLSKPDIVFDAKSSIVPSLADTANVARSMSVGAAEAHQDSYDPAPEVEEYTQERTFKSVLDKLSSSEKSYEAPSYKSYYSEPSFGYNDSAHSFNSTVTESLSDIEREVLESAVSRADDELRDEYGYKNYFSDESLEGITVDDAEIEDPMSISIANDRNMVYINSNDPAHIVNMLRDKSEELALEEPIVNASELPYVVSFYVTGTVIERLLDECRAAGIRDMYLSFQLEASDYDETSLYYLQIDR